MTTNLLSMFSIIRFDQFGVNIIVFIEIIFLDSGLINIAGTDNRNLRLLR